MIKPLNYEGSEDTPSIVLDKNNELFLFEGRSLPEDVNEFYEPVMDWFKSYRKNPLPKTVVHFRLEYFSTATSKLLYDLLIQLDDLYIEGHKVQIKWQYPEMDEDILQAGKEFSEMLEVPFEFKSYNLDAS